MMQILCLVIDSNQLQDHHMSAVILTSLGSMGVMANLALILIIMVKRPLRRC